MIDSREEVPHLRILILVFGKIMATLQYLIESLIIFGSLSFLQHLFPRAHYYHFLKISSDSDQIQVTFKYFLILTSQLVCEHLIILIIYVHLLQFVAIHDLIIYELIVKLHRGFFGFTHTNQYIYSLNVFWGQSRLSLTLVPSTYPWEFIQDTSFYRMKFWLKVQALNVNEEGIEKESVASDLEDVHTC